VTQPLFEKHKATLDRALQAIAERSYWSAYPESPSPKVYGEGAAEAGKAAFDALLNKRFPLTQPATIGQVGHEKSPYGFPLGITYPRADVDGLIAAVGVAEAQWRDAGPEAWVGVCLETLARINRASFELANAIMHTTGQAFVMAFQAGGPHAQDRGLEAVAYAWDQMHRVPATATWEKPQGKNEPLRMEKRFRIVPRGIAVVIAPCTFPTWNGYTGFFASLATGNAVIVKPHPGAILPLAITVRIAREVLADAGYDPNVVTLVAHDPGDDTAQTLALRPEVKIVDFTGARRRSTPRRPASTRSSSIRRRTSKGSCATSRSRCRCIPARCARRRRTSMCRRAESTRPKDISPSIRSQRASPRGSPSCWAIRRARSRSWAPCRTTAC